MRSMGMDENTMQKGISMKDSRRMVFRMGRGDIFGIMVTNIWVNGKGVLCVGKVPLYGKMGISMRGSG